MIKKATDLKRLGFYLWVGLVYMLIWILHDLITDHATFSNRAVNEVWRATYITAVNYLFFEYSLPVIRSISKKFIKALLAIALFIFLISFGLFAWRYFGIQLHIWTSYIDYASKIEGAFDQFSAGLTSIFFFGICKHIYDHIKLKQAAQQLRIEKQEAELNYLKSQTNPHFLFNTLNNIYSLAKDKSDLAPESILRLSKILRFMLYETSGAFINIDQEVKIVTDYIALEKLRYDDSLKVNFTYDIENMQLSIPPLLMIPLVENAFKHGVSETRNNPFIDIHLSADQHQLNFVVKNSTDEREAAVAKENIGLSNLRRQLQLLYTDYNLTVQQKDAVFIASLNINLKSHV